MIERKWDWWGNERDGEIDSKEDGSKEKEEKYVGETLHTDRNRKVGRERKR